MTTLIFDIEANNLMPKVNRLHCLAIKDADTGKEWVFNDEIHPSLFDEQKHFLIEDGLKMMDEADVIVGHNIINYDLPVLEKLRGWKPKAKVRDTLIIGRLIHSNVMDEDFKRRSTGVDFPNSMVGKHSLKAWGYRLGVLKGVHLENNGMEAWTPELQEYCAQDVRVTLALWEHLMNGEQPEVAIELEHQFALIMAQQEKRGIGFDVPSANALYADLATEKLELDKQLQELFPPKEIQMKMTFWRAGAELFETKSAAKVAGFKDKDIGKGPYKIKRVPFNSQSRDHIAERLQQKGWKPSEFTENGKPKVDETVLTSIPYPEAQMLSRILILQKRMGQLADGAEGWLKLERRGRIHGSVITNGAVTGRCTHRHPNMAQVPRDAKYRALFKPTDGMVFVGCDASGLELRCLAHYMDDSDYITKLLEGDIHTVNQEAAGLPTRDSAKTFIYGFLYGAGDEKIGQIIGKGAAEGKKIRKQFLESLPALGILKKKISTALKQRKWLIGLDRRRLHVRSEHAALNTLLQSAGAVVMKAATINTYNNLIAEGLDPFNDFAFVAHVHDEFQIETWPEMSDLVSEVSVRSIVESGEQFNFRCRLDGEAKSGSNWSETH